MECNIRKAVAQDIPYLYSIALKTAFSGLDGTDYFSDPWCVGHYYSAPYFFFEPDVCFIALDEHHVPAGYIVGTSDTEAFKTYMNQSWLPPLQAQYNQIDYFKSEAEESLIKMLRKGPGEGVWEHMGYPSHLHIDLLESMQGKGIGRSLMQTFFSAIKAKGVTGIHLGVDGRNTRAFGFYERIGFNELESKNWGSIFGIKLT